MSDPCRPAVQCLVVANQTLLDASLASLIRNRLDRGHARVHLLVPQVSSKSYNAELYAMSMAASAGISLPWRQEADMDGGWAAQRTLDAALEQFWVYGSQIDGEAVGGDPMAAIGSVLDQQSFDEIVISTLPARISAWLGLDLPCRVRRRFGIPVTHLMSGSSDETQSRLLSPVRQLPPEH